jgi:phosphatidylinositol-3-phosphatase
MKRAILLTILLCATAAVGLGRDASPPAQAAGLCGGSTARIAKVLWVWMENKSYSSVIGSGSATYENRLAAQCGLATNYHAIGHPSLPNYIAATAGATRGITTDCEPASCPVTGSSIFGQGRPARSYAESMPSNCYLSPASSYVPRHNPEVYFTAVRSACRNGGDVPLGTPSFGNLRRDLNAGALRPFSFVIPNVCHDTHNCSVATGDAYLRSLLPVIFASPDYASGRLLVVLTWDEAAGDSSNHVPAIVASRRTRPGTVSGTRFTHYSLLRTTEGLLGLPLLRNAARATSMRAAFGL